MSRPMRVSETVGAGPEGDVGETGWGRWRVVQRWSRPRSWAGWFGGVQLLVSRLGGGGGVGAVDHHQLGTAQAPNLQWLRCLPARPGVQRWGSAESAERAGPASNTHIHLFSAACVAASHDAASAPSLRLRRPIHQLSRALPAHHRGALVVALGCPRRPLACRPGRLAALRAAGPGQEA